MSSLRRTLPSFIDMRSFACCVLLCVMVSMLVGCPKKDNQTEEDEEPVSFGDLKVLVIEDEPLVEAVRREWSARAEVDLEVAAISVEEFRKLEKVEADIVIYPAGMLGEMVEGKHVISFPSEALDDSRFARDDNLPFARSAEVKWGKRQYAVSFGCPQLLLAYRSDLLAELGADPPTTWEEYSELAGVLNTQPPEGVEGWQPIAEPRAKGWAAQLLLAKAAPYAREPSRYSVLFDYNTMEPQLTSPAFERALTEMIAAAKLSPASQTYDPQQALDALLSGNAGMAITWPTPRAASGAEEHESLSIEFAQLPGSTDLYNTRSQEWQAKESAELYRVPVCSMSGRLGSVTRNSKRSRAAALCLAILAGQELSPTVSPYSTDTAIFRLSQTAAPELWVDPELDGASVSYADAMTQTHNERYWVFCPRIPGRERYLQALEDAVQSALAGDEEPSQALANATKAWEAITEEIGRENQKSAYRHSLGLN